MRAPSPAQYSVTAASPLTQDLTDLVLHNLQHQHEWRDLCVHSADCHLHADIDALFAPLFKDSHPRQLISGLPPRRMYIHPDEQIAALEIEKQTGTRPDLAPEYEWVMAVQLSEKWAVQDFAAMFAVIDAMGDTQARKGWVRSFKQKRLVLAIVHPDSTVVYYLVHDGAVKPRQN
ncbi:hypothetical protein TD95_002856 [Thielaviopsis punctulata]|uniref:tRNA-splicing endonuclease subunit Sen15 domain-containing protein n=1 Tax=Thielaviopsis punctulata TaxID=72032 RepID=A0A0F4ZFX9_9PEZI|nr:hypothetical protein TD95_002856 [Thielaviopsis punctulata]